MTRFMTARVVRAQPRKFYTSGRLRGYPRRVTIVGLCTACTIAAKMPQPQRNCCVAANERPTHRARGSGSPDHARQPVGCRPTLRNVATNAIGARNAHDEPYRME